MRIRFNLLLPVIAVIALNSCKTIQKEYLFNGKDLENWVLFTKEPVMHSDSVYHVSEGIIHVSGMPFGYIRTTREFSNYKLHVEYRWPGTPANSGVFVHANGENRIWPVCYETQLKHSNAGDFVLMGVGTHITINDSTYRVPPSDRPYMACPKFSETSEKPAGEWNTVEVLCTDNSIEISVNGVLQNKGTNLAMNSGSICLQSEGGPVQFRNVYIESLK